MCGICGMARPDGIVDPATIERMMDTIAHRGPDGAGLHCADGVGLGHRRLSVIDIDGGAQPLCNEDGTVWVTFNGEIFNFQTLRAELEDKGHQFRTRCDTEILVHGYEEFGLDLPRRLNGMFAFAIHDQRRRRLLLVRDHLGIKPMFYAEDSESVLYFGSEIKALLAGMERRPGIDPDAMAEYLIFRYVAGARTLFKEIRRLAPGHLAVWDRDGLSVRRYWSPTDVPIQGDLPEDEAVRQLDARLDASVHSQLMSDVPLGTFCSGGIDSGLVTAFAARHASDHLHTFSVGFDDPEWDETPLARDTADRYGTTHHVLTAEAHHVGDLLEKLVWYHDEPLSHPNSIPLYLLSRFARERVTVILTGEGADELFCGYPRYHFAKAASGIDRFAPFARSAIAGALGRFPHHRAQLASRILRHDFEDALIFNSSYVPPEEVLALTGQTLDGVLAERRQLLSQSIVPGDAIASLSRYELQTYLVCALDRMDRMAMASGLETRVPFLDVDLVEWGLALPSTLKTRGRQNKYVLKKAARSHLGPAVVSGRKSGFGLPLASWFRQAQGANLLGHLEDIVPSVSALIDKSAVRRLATEHRTRLADHSELLWLLLNLSTFAGHDHSTHSRSPSFALPLRS